MNRAEMNAWSRSEAERKRISRTRFEEAKVELIRNNISVNDSTFSYQLNNFLESHEDELKKLFNILD